MRDWLSRRSLYQSIQSTTELVSNRPCILCPLLFRPCSSALVHYNPDLVIPTLRPCTSVVFAIPLASPNVVLLITGSTRCHDTSRSSSHRSRTSRPPRPPTSRLWISGSGYSTLNSLQVEPLFMDGSTQASGTIQVFAYSGSGQLAGGGRAETQRRRKAE